MFPESHSVSAVLHVMTVNETSTDIPEIGLVCKSSPWPNTPDCQTPEHSTANFTEPFAHGSMKFSTSFSAGTSVV